MHISPWISQSYNFNIVAIMSAQIA
jgi:hypothetical protein